MPLASKPISAYRPPARQPSAWGRSRAIKKPPLWEFVFLSLLVHALAITLFGAPSGGSREGRALWGSLQVVLQGAPVDEGPALKIDRGVHLRGLRGETAPRPAPPARAEKPKARVEPVAPPVEAPRMEVPKTDTPFSMPPLLDRIPTPELKLEPMRPLQVPPPTKEQSVRPPPPAPPAPTPPAPEVRAPSEPPASRVERVPAAEAPVVSAPLLQPLPPAPLPERLATPPVIERPPVETPVVPATPAIPPVERAPVEVPAIPVPQLESVAPARSEPAVKPAEKTPVQEAPAARTLPPAIERVESPVTPREAPAKVDRAPPPIEPPAAASATPFRAPPAEPIRPRTDEPSTNYDPTAAPPSVDLDAIRKRAASLGRQGTGNRALLPFPMPAPPERKTKEQIAIENARKPDCRTAYQGLGLAAVVPLIANEFGEGACRW